MNNYGKFVRSKLKNSNQVIDTLTSDKLDALHCAVGLCGETGELVDMIKKHVFNERDLDRQKLILDLGDIEFYLQGLRTALAIDRDEVITRNVIKLNARYRDGYSDAAAAARADESEENQVPKSS